jgi:SAM-dependent methyltransferase
LHLRPNLVRLSDRASPRLPFRQGKTLDFPLDLGDRMSSLLAGDTAPQDVYSGTRMSQRAALDTPPGRGRYCPICRRWYRRFLPFGIQRRHQALCPGCGALERHRYLWLYLETALGVTSRSLSVLHIAPEAGIRQRLLDCRSVRYTSIDLHDPSAAMAMDAGRLAFDAGSFDLILCCHVLEHIQDDHAALGEFARVLRPGGHAIILVPMDENRPQTFEDPSIICTDGRMKAFGHPYHVRICGRDYGDRIARSGFHVTAVSSREMSAHSRRFYRINRLTLFDCQLPAHQVTGAQ